MRLLNLFIWSLKLDYVFLFRIGNLPFSRKAYFVFFKYLLFIKNKLIGFNEGRSYVTIFGNKYYYNDVYGIASLQRVYCEHFLLKRFVPENGTVLDIGANIGQFNFFARHYLKSKRVISIEPIDSCFALLKQNSDIAHDCLNFAVSNKSENLTVFMSKKSLQLSSYVKSENDIYEKSFTIQSKRLDDLIHDLEIEKVNMIKIDTEGSEHDILTSIGPRLMSSVDTISVEMSVFRNSTGNFFKIGSFLENHKFKLFALNPFNGNYPVSIEGIFCKQLDNDL